MMNNQEPGRVIYRVWGFICGCGRDGSSSVPARLYDVYEDGSFQFFMPNGERTQELEGLVQEREQIEKHIEQNNRLGFGGITGFNRASHHKYEKAFLTLCKLGYGPQNKGFLGGEVLERELARCKYVEYFGEDEPWIDVYEYDERHGLPFVIYD